MGCCSSSLAERRSKSPLPLFLKFASFLTVLGYSLTHLASLDWLLWKESATTAIRRTTGNTFNV